MILRAMPNDFARYNNSSILGGFTYSDFGANILAIFNINSLYPGADGAEPG